MTAIGRVDEFDRRYYVDPISGEAYDSVTTIISATRSMPWLTAWASKLAAEFAVDSLALIQQTLAEAGRPAAVELVKGAAKRKREAAAERGSGAHAVIEALLLDSTIPVMDDHDEQIAVESIVDGYLAFDEDFSPLVEMAEATVANEEHRYAGTLDAVMRFPSLRRRLLIDVKSGANLDAQIAAQLAAYRNATTVWLPQGQKADMPKVDGVAILHLRPEYDRGYKLIEVDDSGAFAWYLAMCLVFKSEQARPKRIGKPLYKPLPDGSQPAPHVTDVEELSRYAKVLIGAGITDLDQLLASTATVSAIKGIGPKAVDVIVAVLADHVLTLTKSVA